ncbi:hypothetical protein MSAN_02192900 [Mycena sanguinolenta]|uniref:Uncharacterized protein n=1 Tax=Mycena sanguinolenta TaxID=230812 RepID=A0A8H6XDS9_9AGAR|nr:hypothetical protein MSAN_02192900 [Mycena sanguinolenta]
MRCVSLWEMAHRGAVRLENNIWASTEYEQPAMTDYGAPHLPYNWDTRFNLWGFEKHIRSSNAIEICNWRASDIFGRLDPYSDFCDELEVNQNRYRRIISAPTVDALLSQKNDLMLQVFLPPKFADYASNVIQAQAQAGLPPDTASHSHRARFQYRIDPQGRAIFLADRERPRSIDALMKYSKCSFSARN